jgi:hypothetical protein
MCQNILHKKVQFFILNSSKICFFITDYTAGFGGKFGVQKEEPSRLPDEDSVTPPSGMLIFVFRSIFTISLEPKVVEKVTPPVSTKADVGNMRAK